VAIDPSQQSSAKAFIQNSKFTIQNSSVASIELVNMIFKGEVSLEKLLRNQK
jgi:hypothetical protein